MRIGFDAKRAVFNQTGLGNYSRTLVGNLSNFFPRNEYLLYTPGFRSSRRVESLEKRENIEFITPSSGTWRLSARLWRSFGIKKQLRRDKLDIFHGLSNELPFGMRGTGIKSVVTIHDMIFKRFPNLYPMLDRLGYGFKVASSCRNADAIIAVSEQTREDIIEYEKVDPDNVHLIYQCCDESFTTEVPADEREVVRRRYNLPTEFVLYVGAIEERKNLQGIIKAIELMKPSIRPHLLALGNGREYLRETQRYIAGHGLTENVSIISNAEFADFPAIYQMAALFIYPSIFEGFGIPIIEALWSKTAVVTTRGGVFPEAGGPSSRYIDPTDIEELADTITSLLADGAVRTKMAEEGYEYVQRFRADIVTRQVMALYEGLSGKNIE